MIERWRRIPSFPEYYASTLGRIRKGDRVLTTGCKHGNYPKASVQKDGVIYQRSVHILVCEAFHGRKPTPKHEVCHADGSKDNNVPENLRWGTRADNYADRVKHETCNRGERMGWAKMTESKVREIRKKNGRGISYSKLMKEYDLSKSAVWAIVTKVNWRHV